MADVYLDAVPAFVWRVYDK